MRTASWVIVRRDTGQAQFETFERWLVAAIRRRLAQSKADADRFEVVPIGEWLARVNRAARLRSQS